MTPLISLGIHAKGVNEQVAWALSRHWVISSLGVGTGVGVGVGVGVSVGVGVCLPL